MISTRTYVVGRYILGVPIVVHPATRADKWKAELTAALPNEELWFWPDAGDPADVEYVIAWVMSRKHLAMFTNLKAIFSLGAGTEQWQKPGIDVPVVRLADPAMANEMASYCVAWVVRHHRGFAEAERLQRATEWKIPDRKLTAEFRVGVLGYGEIGSTIGRAFTSLGYPVNAWTRSGRKDTTVTHYAGEVELENFLASSDAIINVLPSTDATIGLLNADRLAQCSPGAFFVNVGRGAVLGSEDELVAALDHGPLAAAVLDVTNPEPPLAESPLFQHPAVTLTAHISGTTQVRSAAQLIAANVGRLRAGEAAFPLLDRGRGY